MTALVRVANLKKAYRTRALTFEALKGVTLEIAPGDFVAIMGPSGSGKSTLLHLIGGLDRPSGGMVRVAGQEPARPNETALAKFRRGHVGFVFQFFNLIDNLTVQANVELPALLAGEGRRSVRERAVVLPDRLGIAAQAHKYPWGLSGGRQQRVAIARALINGPTLLSADDPTGDLDGTGGREGPDIPEEFNRQGQTTFIVTHDTLTAARACTVLIPRDGRIVDDLPGGDPRRIARHLANLQR